MTLLLWLLGVLAAFAAASTVAVYSFGRFARQARGANAQSLPPAPDATALDRLLSPLLKRHPGQSGLALVHDNLQAFDLRQRSARLAGRSLDLMYYIWRDDMTGRLLAHELIAAADRGVRVRLLLDDVNVQGVDPKFRALNGHPGIEVRLFNPIRSRRTVLGRGLEILLSVVRFNRRMHGKLWIADGRLAITGGRNIGNTYFDADLLPRHNARDIDLLMLGPLVDDSARLFDAYWNSGLALPIAAFWRNYDSGLHRFRRRLDASTAGRAALDFRARLPQAGDPGGEPLLVPGLRWTDTARLIADPPEKALARGREAWLLDSIQPVLESARQSLDLATPYFVPGWQGMLRLADLARSGVDVALLTNALAVTDHTLVHGAYRRYRRPLLAAGVRIHEFAPPVQAGGTRQMLHAKGFCVDGRTAFVGTFNFDLRSAFLNTEIGVMFQDPDLVEEFQAVFRDASSAEAAYRLSLSDGLLQWRRSAPGPGLASEPEAPAFRRGASWAIGHLPIHSYL